MEELTACKVEHEKLALAIDSSRHQLFVSGLDITHEGTPQCMLWCLCDFAIIHAVSLVEELVRELQACKCLIEEITSLSPSWKGSEVHLFSVLHTDIATYMILYCHTHTGGQLGKHNYSVG